MLNLLLTRFFRKNPIFCIVCHQQTKEPYYFPVDVSKRDPLCEDCFCKACMFHHCIDAISKQSNAAAACRKEALAYLHPIQKQKNQAALVMLNEIAERYGVQLESCTLKNTQYQPRLWRGKQKGGEAL